MSICVSSCGRSGTNLVLEILSGNSKLQVSKEVEDKKFFKRHNLYPQIFWPFLWHASFNKYFLTKCDTVYYDVDDLDKAFKINKHLKIIWTIRDPRDMILSKLQRGQIIERGGECKEISDDGTPQGCISDLNHMYNIFRHIEENFEDQLLLIRMEDVILDIEVETRTMCDFLNIPFEIKMLDFLPRMRNEWKRRRYNSLDKNQVQLWKDWQNIYDGFFLKNKYPIKSLFEQTKPMQIKFGY
tara:strand:- start:233 stop:955 length:723 start_codon:yes stop_codon:yes gene_type:complete